MINPFRALQLSRRLFSRKPAAPRLGPAKRRRSRRITRSIESLEDRTLLAVVLPGGVSSVASTLASFLPGSILTSVNDALAGGNSSALLYAAFDGEANHVRISGSYLNLFLLVDDDPHVPVVRVPPC